MLAVNVPNELGDLTEELARLASSGGTVFASPLEEIVLIKKAEAALAALKADLQEQANDEYLELCKEAGSTSLEIQGALLRKYNPKTIWSYSAEVISKEAALTAMKAKEKSQEVAKASLGNKSTEFVVKLS
jgi:hypothetical protein